MKSSVAKLTSGLLVAAFSLSVVGCASKTTDSATDALAQKKAERFFDGHGARAADRDPASR